MRKKRITALALSLALIFSSMSFNSYASDVEISNSNDIEQTQGLIDEDEQAQAQDLIEEDINTSSSSVEIVEEEENLDDNIELLGIDWVKGWTGSKTSNYKISSSDENIKLEITAKNTGKISSSEDSLAYCATKISADADFTLSADMTVNSYNTLGGTNPHQASFGIMLFDKLYNKDSDKISYTNSVMLMSYMESSTSPTASMWASSRAGDKRIFHEQLSETYPSKGTDLITIPVKIVKSGTSYVLSCGGKEYAYTDATVFSDDIYPGFFVARDATATFSNVQLNIEQKKVTSIKIVQMPQKLTYGIDDKLDLTGLKVEATYDTGEVEQIEDYIVTGFDSSIAGKKTLTISKGSASVTIDYDVLALECTKINFNYKPIKNTYYIGQHFSSQGMEVSAEFIDGTNRTLESDEYEMLLDGKIINDSTFITNNMIGDKEVIVKLKATDKLNPGKAEGKFNIKVVDATFTSIVVSFKPGKVKYYLGDKLVSDGIIVKAYYTGKDGTTYIDYLSNDEFIVGELDSSKPGDVDILVTSVFDSSIKTSFIVSVEERKEVKLSILEYPRMTYTVGEAFDAKGLVVSSIYNNGDVEVTKEYTLQADTFDSSKAGTTTVTVVPNKDSFKPIVLTITINEGYKHIWKSTIFGQSTSTSKGKVTPEKSGTIDGTIDIHAWGCGKITGDHDGIAYYYTRVDSSNNFTISADITVNRYLQHDNDDTTRSGQEAFGIMARDAIPLKGKDGKIVTAAEEAQLDSNGEPVPNNSGSVFASNIVLAGGYSGTGWPTDPTASNYEKNTKINRINMYIRKGVTAIDAGGLKVGPYSVSDTFPKIGNKYKVTLSKINGGFMTRCYDYQTGLTKDAYSYDADAVLNIINKDTIYVGFFASRYADITIKNAEFFETDPATDPVYNVSQDELYAPGITLLSNDYTRDTEYNLNLKSNNPGGGFVTIKLDDKVLYNNQSVTKRSTSFPVTLVPNAKNIFTILYSPSKSDTLTSYDDMIYRIEIIHKYAADDKDIIYVSPEASLKDADGSRENPYDLDTAIGFVERGQTIVMLEGVYKRTKGIDITLANSGSKPRRKTLRAEEGKEVILDFQGVASGMVLTGSYWTIKGIDFINTGNNLKPFHLGGSNCIIDDCKFYNNGDTGFQISRTYTTDNFEEWPTNNLVINCETFNNCDPSMINADGFGAKLTVGNGNIFKGCISHHNVDDGWDLYTKLASGPIGVVTLEDCVSYKQGYRLLEDGSEKPYGAGGHNGYKMGGENIAVQHYMKDCIAFENDANGITSNSNPAMKIRNVISYGNSGGNFSLSSSKKDNYNYDIKGAVSYKGSGSDTIGTFTRDTDYKNASSTPIGSENNYFKVSGSDSKNSNGEIINDGFFKSVNKKDVLTNNRYSQDSTGTFVLGSFLARTNDYVHEKEDLVIIDKEEVTEETTEETTSAVIDTTETTTVLTNVSKSSSSSGSGRSSKLASRTTDKADKEKDIVVKNEDTNTESKSEEQSTQNTTFFNDIANNWAKEYIEVLASKGIINGISKTEFMPNKEITRADFIKIIVNAIGASEYTPSNNNPFKDVNENDYFYNDVLIAQELGLISGKSFNEFSPKEGITREDAVVIINRVIDKLDIALIEPAREDFNDIGKVSSYAQDSVKKLSNAGIVNGDLNNNFNPKNKITRAEAAKILYSIIELIQ